MANSRKKIRHNLNDHENCTTKISSTHTVALRSKSKERVRNPPPRTPGLRCRLCHARRISSCFRQIRPSVARPRPARAVSNQGLETHSQADQSSDVPVRNSSAQRATYIVPSCPNLPAGPQPAAAAPPQPPAASDYPTRSFPQLPDAYTVSGMMRRWMANSGSSFLKSKGL